MYKNFFKWAITEFVIIVLGVTPFAFVAISPRIYITSIPIAPLLVYWLILGIAEIFVFKRFWKATKLLFVGVVGGLRENENK